MPANLLIRLDPDLKTKAEGLARLEGKSMSQVVRNLLKGYVEDRDMGSYLDDLWRRTGEKLKANGVEPSRISHIIKAVRREKHQSRH